MAVQFILKKLSKWESMEQKRILVVDDEDAILLAFKRLLQHYGLDVDTCDNLSSAVDHINRWKYDAVIADLRLSGTLAQEGFEIIALVKKKSQLTKVALITAYGTVGLKEKAHDAGADFYFEKPVSVKDLNEVLGSIGVLT
jgi:DNA-binding NtrC family response regulator